MKFWTLAAFGLLGSLIAFSETTNIMAPDAALRDRVMNNNQMRLNQIAKQDAEALRQKLWEVKTYVGSPNIVGKITTMSEPLNAKGQLIEVQIITYYWSNHVRYATGSVDKVTER